MATNVQDFGANDGPAANPSATGPTGSTASTDGVTGTYGNTHSTTGRANPIHASDPQSTAHPAYGNSKFTSPYETGGGNPTQGGAVGGGQGVGSAGGLVMGKDYHDSVDAAYAYATGPEPPAGYGAGAGTAGPYDTAGGNSTQTAPTETSTHIGGTAPATNTTGATTGTTAEAIDNRSTGSKVKEMAHGVKGLFAAVHGAGESVRGNFNAGVDKTFHEVLDPHPIPFPSLRPLREYAEDDEGEFPSYVYTPITTPQKRKISIQKEDGIKTSGEQKNRTLAAEGEQEMATGMFSDRTKEREGVVPGDRAL